MLYENELCPGCGQAMAEGDDVVVCPVCATPQHRACWQKENQCVNTPLHESGYVWHGAEPGGEPEKKEEGQPCPFCETMNAADALHCESCGCPMDAGTKLPPLVREIFQAGPKEFIGGENAADVTLYVRTSIDRYMPRFQRFSEGGSSFSWNWAAFFFAPFWFFYRRMYNLGVFFVVTLATLTLVTAIPLSDFQQVYSQHYDEIVSEETTDARIMEIEQELRDAIKPAYPFLGVNLLLRAVCAIIANKAYYKKVLAELKKLHATSTNAEMFRFLVLERGGTSALSFAMGFFGYELLYQAMIYLSDKITTI